MKVKIEENIDEVTEKLVKPSSGGGYVYLPKTWVGKRVKILLINDDKPL